MARDQAINGFTSAIFQSPESDCRRRFHHRFRARREYAVAGLRRSLPPTSVSLSGQTAAAHVYGQTVFRPQRVDKASQFNGDDITCAYHCDVALRQGRQRKETAGITAPYSTPRMLGWLGRPPW